MPAAPRSATAALAGAYALYFAAIGVTLPFMPAYLRGMGLTATQVGVLLATGPAVSLLAPPLWGALADRTGASGQILAALSASSALLLSALLWVRGFLPALVTLVGFAAFNSAIPPLADSMTLRASMGLQGGFARVRLFGSLGFIAASVLFGFAAVAHPRATVAVPAVLMGALSLVAGARLGGATAGLGVPLQERPPRSSGLLLPGRTPFFLAACALHWVASGPYNGDFAIYVKARGLPLWVVGAAVALGTSAEVVVMMAYGRLAPRISDGALLMVSFAASSVRWVAMALAGRAWELVLVSLLHGLTFGAFYVAAVAYLARRVPEERRAAGQAAFAAVTFGLGGLVGYLGAGAGFDLLGGRFLFLAAGGVELLACAALAPALSSEAPAPC